MILFVQCSAGKCWGSIRSCHDKYIPSNLDISRLDSFRTGCNPLHSGVSIDLLFDTAQVWVWHWMPKAFARTSASESPKKGGYPQRRTNMMTWRKVFWKSAGCFWDLSTKEDFKTRIIAIIGPWSRQVVHIAHHLLDVFLYVLVSSCVSMQNLEVSQYRLVLESWANVSFPLQTNKSVLWWAFSKNPKQFGLTRRNKGKHAEQYTTAPEICGLRFGWGQVDGWQ